VHVPECQCQRLWTAITVAEKVQVPSRTEGIGDPCPKKQSAFEDEAVTMRGQAETIEQTLQGKAREENLVIRIVRAGPLKQSGTHRSTDIASITRHLLRWLPHMDA
jgi:hypothetical protein